MSTRSQSGPRALDRSAGSPPLWQQVRGDVVARLDAGEFLDRFPGELELVAEYAVSRHTVREALRRLRQDGLIASSRGRAPVARRGMISQELGALYSLFRELESRGIEQRSEVRRAELVRDPEVSARLEVDGETPLVLIERVRLADDAPVATDRVWMLAEIAEPILDADLTHTGLYDALIAHSEVRVTGGRETIGSRLASPEEAERLGAADDEPLAVLSIERTGRVDDRLVEWRETVVRGDRFRFVAQWGPEHGYGLDVGHA